MAEIDQLIDNIREAQRRGLMTRGEANQAIRELRDMAKTTRAGGSAAHAAARGASALPPTMGQLGTGTPVTPPVLAPAQTVAPMEFPTRVLTTGTTALPAGPQLIPVAPAPSTPAPLPRTLFSPPPDPLASAPRTIMNSAQKAAAIETRALPVSTNLSNPMVSAVSSPGVARTAASLADDVVASAADDAALGWLARARGSVAASPLGSWAAAHPRMANVGTGLAVGIGGNLAASGIDRLNIGGKDSKYDRTFSAAARGAATGAGLGSFGGPVGAGIGAGVGGVVGAFMGSRGKPNYLKNYNTDVEKGRQQLNQLAVAYGLNSDQWRNLMDAYNKEAAYYQVLGGDKPDASWVQSALPNYVAQFSNVQQSDQALSDATQRALALQASIGRYTTRQNNDSNAATQIIADQYRATNQPERAAQAEYYNQRYNSAWSNAMQMLPQASAMQSYAAYNNAQGMDPYAPPVRFQPTFAMMVPAA